MDSTAFGSGFDFIAEAEILIYTAQTVSGVYSLSYQMSTGVLYPGTKRQGHEDDHLIPRMRLRGLYLHPPPPPICSDKQSYASAAEVYTGCHLTSVPHIHPHVH
jgi:hypothetical protein